MLVQNQDRNIGPAHYDLLSPDQLLVTKIFLTHQGEGPFAGRPAIFLRLAGCNRGAKLTMGCSFCDTAFQFDQGKAMRFHEIKFEMEQIFETQRNAWREEPILVITGGEPMMQDHLIYFLKFAKEEMGVPMIQVESNGDRLIPNFPADSGIFLVVSPKITREGYREMREDVAARANALKFLISGDPLSPYYQLPESIWTKRGSPVLLSPITEYLRELKPGEVVDAWGDGLIDREATAKNYAYAAKLASERGYRLSMQTHLFFGVE